VTRCKIGILTLTLLVAPSATLLVASSAEAAPAKVQVKLSTAVTTLQSLKDRLQTARVALKAALSSGDAAQVSAQRAIIRQVKPQIRKLARRIHRLRFVITHPMARGRHGSWMPVLRAAAKRYHLSAQALHRMMLLESGGRTRAVGGGGAFLGLFQYSPGTWKAKPARKPKPKPVPASTPSTAASSGARATQATQPVQGSKPMAATLGKLT